MTTTIGTGHRPAIGADLHPASRVITCTCGWSRRAPTCLAETIADSHARLDTITTTVRQSRTTTRRHPDDHDR